MHVDCDHCQFGVATDRTCWACWEGRFAAGAAVAFGLMGMAKAIGAIPSIEACPDCLLAKSAWVYDFEAWPKPHYRRCLECFDARSDDRGEDT